MNTRRKDHNDEDNWFRKKRADESIRVVAPSSAAKYGYYAKLAVFAAAVLAVTVILIILAAFMISSHKKNTQSADPHNSRAQVVQEKKQQTEKHNSSNTITTEQQIEVIEAIPAIPEIIMECEPAAVTVYEGRISDSHTSDTYSVTPTNNGLYRFELKNVPNDVYFGMILYNDRHEELDWLSMGGNGDCISAFLDTGSTYYIEISQYYNSGSYQFTVGEERQTADIGDANIIADRMSFTDQENNYTIHTATGGIYRFELSDVPKDVYFDMYFYNSEWEEFDWTSFIGNGEGLTEELEADRTYHIKVKQREGTGSYTLKTGSPKAIAALTANTATEDSMQFTGQQNRYSFTPGQNGSFRFELRNVPENTYFNIHYFNSDWEEFDSSYSVNDGDGLTEKLSAGKTCYITVEQSEGYGSYQLQTVMLK